MISTYIFNIITSIWIFLAVSTFLFLLFITAPYGRYTKSGWGKLIDNRLGWIIMELPSFLIILFFSIFFIRNFYALFLAAIWLLHYFYRTFIFPFRLHTKDKKMPLSIILSAICFNGVNATLNGYFLTHFATYQISNFFDSRFYLGTFLLIIGTIIHMQSDRILINLRKPGESGYKIPYGFLFKYVSCPNFFGEIVVWTGYSIMAWNIASLSFLIWTIANVLPRGLKHHKWYMSHFNDYPMNRKAVFPFIL